MKFIAPLTKTGLTLLVIFLVGCSSGPKKTEIRAISVSGSNSAQKAVSVNPAIQQDYQAALRLMKNKNYAEAERILVGIAQAQPDLAGPSINLGIIYLNEEKLEEAEAQFVQAREKSPRNAEIYNYLGIIYRQQGKFNEAEQAYKQAIDINPRLAKAYLNLGMLYDLYVPNYSAALQYYKQYQAINPDDRNIKTWIADLNQRIQVSNL